MEKLRVNMKKAQQVLAAKRKADALLCRRKSKYEDASMGVIAMGVIAMKVASQVEFSCTVLRGLIESTFPAIGDGWERHRVIFAMPYWEPADFDKVVSTVTEYDATLTVKEVQVADLARADKYTWLISKHAVRRVNARNSIEFGNHIRSVNVFDITLNNPEEEEE
jgi:hypothetical protein